MLELTAIAFGEATIAAQAAHELERRADDLAIDPDAIGVVICERSGSYQLMTTRQATATTAWSSYWGRMLKLLMEEPCRSAIDPSFLRSVREQLTPGSSVLFVISTREQGRHVIDALSQYGGSSLAFSLVDDALAELHAAIDVDGAQNLRRRRT